MNPHRPENAASCTYYQYVLCPMFLARSRQFFKCLSLLKEFTVLLNISLVLLAMLVGNVQAEIAVVLNSRDASISIINTASLDTQQVIEVGKEPHHLMLTPDKTSLIVANSASDELFFLDPQQGKIKRRIKNIADPYQIGFSPDGKWFVANCLRLDRVDIYEVQGQGEDKTFHLVKRVPLPKLPSHMIFSADSKWVFVTLQGSDELAAIDLTTQTLAWKMKLGKQPAGIWMTPDDQHLLVGIMGQNYVDVINWRDRKGLRHIITGDGAHNFRPLGDGRHVFVSNRVANTISLIDQQTLQKIYDISVPGGPDCMDITPDHKQIWVTSRWLKRISVVDIDTRKIIKTIPVGRSPHGIYLAKSAAWK